MTFKIGFILWNHMNDTTVLLLFMYNEKQLQYEMMNIQINGSMKKVTVFITFYGH